MKNCLEPFDRLVLIILGALILILTTEIIAGDQSGLALPVFLPHGAEAIGVFGPVVLQFNDEMDEASVESRFSVSPDVHGRILWKERSLWFYADTPMQAGEQYTIRLSSGASGKFGRRINQEVDYSINIREPDILYLSPASTRPELWRAALDGTRARQLTRTGGMVYDYDVTKSGNKIVFSVTNQSGGVDLWVMDGTGSNVIELVKCQEAKCITPKWSVNEHQIAYSRISRGIYTSNQPTTNARIYIVDSETGQTAPLFDDDTMTGYDPVWSPDGHRLAYYDNLEKGVRITRAGERGKDIFLPSNLEQTGSWSADSQKMIFGNLELSESGQAYVLLYEAHIENEQAVPILQEQPDRYDYSAPQFAPQGHKIAVGMRLMGGAINKQVWIIDLDNQETLSVTSDQRYTHAAYQWQPSGQALVYQRLAPLSSDFKPEVVVWTQDSGEKVIALDAAIPHWIP